LGYVRSVETSQCTACGETITDTEFVTEGVVRVLDKTGPTQFHLRCFEWSTPGATPTTRSAKALGANLTG